jgi:hypothetical protein
MRKRKGKWGEGGRGMDEGKWMKGGGYGDILTTIVWDVQAEAESKLRKEGRKLAEDELAADIQARKEAMRAETGPLVPGGSL